MAAYLFSALASNTQTDDKYNIEDTASNYNTEM